MRRLRVIGPSSSPRPSVVRPMQGGALASSPGAGYSQGSRSRSVIVMTLKKARSGVSKAVKNELILTAFGMNCYQITPNRRRRIARWVRPHFWRRGRLLMWANGAAGMCICRI